MLDKAILQAAALSFATFFHFYRSPHPFRRSLSFLAFSVDFVQSRQLLKCTVIWQFEQEPLRFVILTQSTSSNHNGNHIR